MYRVNLPKEFPVDLPTKGYDWDDKGFLHIFKQLPGITLPVLQQHLEDLLQAGHPDFPVQVAPHPDQHFGYVITVHSTHPVAIQLAADVQDLGVPDPYGFLEEALEGIYL
jgi:hypothetical protein